MSKFKLHTSVNGHAVDETITVADCFDRYVEKYGDKVIDLDSDIEVDGDIDSDESIDLETKVSEIEAETAIEAIVQETEEVEVHEVPETEVELVVAEVEEKVEEAVEPEIHEVQEVSVELEAAPENKAITEFETKEKPKRQYNKK